MKKTVILYIFFLAFSLSGMHAYCGQISRIELTDGSVINGEIISFADGMYDISTDSLGEMKISFTPPPERSRGQHCPSVVLGLLEAGKPHDTRTGGMA